MSKKLLKIQYLKMFVNEAFIATNCHLHNIVTLFCHRSSNVYALDDLVDVITFATIDGFKRNILLTQVEDKHFITPTSILSLQKNSLQVFCASRKTLLEELNTLPSTTTLFFFVMGTITQS
jgi:hypothetical protein